MRFTNKLLAQHIGWQFKQHWQVQGRRIPNNTGAQADLEKLGINVKEVNEVLYPTVEHEKIEITGVLPRKFLDDETHPDWHSEPCYVFGDKNVPLEGVAQAQLLTKTIAFEGLPKNVEESIRKTELPSSVNKSIQNSILESHCFDAEQKKLPIVKVPERPAYVLPRSYGVSESRKNRLLVSKLVFQCEKLAGRPVTSQRSILNDVNFSFTSVQGVGKVQFNLSGNTLITSKKSIEPVKGKFDGELPDMYPVNPTITIPSRNIYVEKNFYPLTNTVSCSHPHTIFAHYSPNTVKNLHETPVTADQFHSRTLLKAFTAAASRASQLYGDSVGTLPKPIVVQSIQTDGKTFHFGVFQLNTLALDNADGLKNYWFNVPSIDLFWDCSYRFGRPVLDGYNKDVFRYLNAFYNNC